MTDCKETYSKPEKKDMNNVRSILGVSKSTVMMLYISHNKVVEEYDLYHEQEMKKERERLIKYKEDFRRAQNRLNAEWKENYRNTFIDLRRKEWVDEVLSEDALEGVIDEHIICCCGFHPAGAISAAKAIRALLEEK